MSFTKYYENVGFAVFMIRAYKFRSALTLIGIIVGIWTIIVTTSIINGIDGAVKQQLDSFGPESIFISKTNVTGIKTGRISNQMRNRKGLTFEDSEAIAELPAVKVSVPFLNVSNNYQGRKIPVSTNNKTSLSVRLEGTIPDYMESGQEFLSSGRFFTDYENKTNQRVCVFRSLAAQTFFPDEDAVGRNVNIDGEQYRIVGVLARREQMFGGGSGINDLNNGIFIPFERAQKMRPDVRDLFILGVAQKDRLTEATGQIENLLRNRRKLFKNEESDFVVSSATGVLDEFHSLTFGITVVMILVSSIGLLVGGIGVMNIMLISVTERTAEIGLRKSLGARQRDIRIQFLVEAVTLNCVGGVIGLLLGWLSTFAIKMYVPSTITFWIPFVGIFISLMVGILSGYIPARRAAKVDPIVALRYE